MNLNEKDVKRLSTLLLIAILCILAFFVVKPLLIAILSGLLLAYVVYPIYKRILKLLKSQNLAAAIVLLLIIVVIFLPLWFVLPLVINQISELFSQYQTLDAAAIVKSFFPTASERFVTQATLTLNNLFNNITLYISKALIDFLLNIPYFLIDLFIMSFVFFYALRDAEKLREFVKAISPLSEHNEQVLVGQFKAITDSILFGQIIIGIVQGLCAGLGFAMFGISNGLVLTILAIFFSIIPFIGAWVVWGPVSIYLFASGSTETALAYLAYNLLIVSLVDNILRSYLISRKAKVSPAVVIVGMIGGIYLFNLLGLILGPLILAYLISLLESLDKSVYSLFSGNN
jgi:predicted PurR-regulated permease PerM